MSDVITEFTNINFLTKAQYSEISNPSMSELWAIETPNIVETNEDGEDGYIIWSNGYCEQWGRVAKALTHAEVTVGLHKTMADVNYNCQITLYSSTTGTHTSSFNAEYVVAYDLKVNSFKVYSSTEDNLKQMWRVSGYISEA